MGRYRCTICTTHHTSGPIKILQLRVLPYVAVRRASINLTLKYVENEDLEQRSSDSYRILLYTIVLITELSLVQMFQFL